MTSAAYHLQSIMPDKSPDTSTESINLFDSYRKWILSDWHYCL